MGPERLHSAICGPQKWVDDTLAPRGPTLHEIRRRYELLRSARTRYYRQYDGDSIDLSAYVESQVAFRNGLPLEQRLYTIERRTGRGLAVLLLVTLMVRLIVWLVAASSLLISNTKPLLQPIADA